jgi:hypothetical protein
MCKILIIVLLVCLAQANAFLGGDKKTTTTTQRPTSAPSTTTTTTTTTTARTLPQSHHNHNNNVNSGIEKWTEAEVTKWANEQKFGIFITKNINGFNGVQLHELFLIRNQAPEVFYSLIKENTVSVPQFVKFSAELKKLFVK